jgi:hypothetical protein
MRHPIVRFSSGLVAGVWVIVEFAWNTLDWLVGEVRSSVRYELEDRRRRRAGR